MMRPLYPQMPFVEYNLFGHRVFDTDNPQEENLLYIALIGG